MQRGPDKLREKIEYLLIFGTAGASLFIAITDLTGLLDSNSWVAQRVPSLTLLAVGFIAGYLALERQGELRSMANSLEQSREDILTSVSRSSSSIVKALSGVEVVSFSSSAELVAYAGKRFREATRIDDVTWSGSETIPRSREDIEAYQVYQNAISEVAESRNKIWREVMIFHSLSRFEREKERVMNAANVGYSLAYYDLPSPNAPRRFGFAIVDNEEVLLSYSPTTTWLTIRHPDVARYFSGYFEDLWKDANKIKQANEINREELDRLEADLRERFQI